MIPGIDQILKSSPVKTGAGQAISDPTLGGVLSGAFTVIFSIVAFLLLIWLIWGALEYILAGGDKEKLSKAQKRLTWAVIGFLLVALAFTISQYVKDVLNPAQTPITPISTPFPTPGT